MESMPRTIEAYEFLDTVDETMDYYASETYSPSPWDTDGGISISETIFEGYVPTTVDPDWWFTIYIISGCLLVNLSLPLFIYLGKRCGFHGNAHGGNRKEADWEVSDRMKDNSKEDALMRQLDDARSVVSGYSHIPGEEGCSVGHSSSVVSGSIAMSQAGTYHDDTASIFSGASGFKDAVLAARVKRTPHARKRAARSKRTIVSNSCPNGDNDNSEHTSDLNRPKSRLDVRMAAEFAKAEMDIREKRNDLNKELYTDITPQTSGSEVDYGEVVIDDVKSVLSQLDVDAISERDAVDARDIGVLKINTYSLNDNNSGYLAHMWDRFMSVVDWDKEMKKYVSLAGYYTTQGILEEAFGLVEIAAISHYLGGREASAYMIVATVTGFTSTITTGFYEACGVLIPQADGARNNNLIGRYMQLAIFFYMLAMIPGAAFWTFYTEKVLLWFKYDEETARIGQLYLLVTLPGYISYGIDAVFYELLNTIGHEAYATWFTFISTILHSGGMLALIYWGYVEDLWLVGVFETASGFFFLFVNFFIMYYQGWLDDYWDGLFKNNGLRDPRAVRTIVNTAIPLSFAWILTYGEWEIMTFFCRTMGDRGAEVTAWNYMGYLWSAFETLTDGFGDAAEVRVGFRMGSGQVRLAKLASDKALYVSLVTACYGTGILFILAMYLPGFLTNDPVIQRMIFDIIPLVGFGQILFVWGMVAWAILGAQGRIRIATALEFFISWGIGAPLAAILVLLFNYNIEGIVGALTISYTISSNVYLYMLHTSDWESLSAVVVARNAAEGKTYDEFDWDELPDNIQDAAVTLGYNKFIWESNEKAESDLKYWEELTPAERKAAGLLGYNKKAWDGDVETEYAIGRDGVTDDASQHSSKSDYWEDLSPDARSAARVLGYTQTMWDNDISPQSEQKDWDELNAKEKHAAQVLGYSKRRWNEEGDSFDDESYFSAMASDPGARKSPAR